MFKLLKTHMTSYLKLNKIIVSCLLLGGILAAMAGLYAYGNLMPWTSANSPEQRQNKYFIFYSQKAQPANVIRSFFKDTYDIFPIQNFVATIALSDDEQSRFTLINGSPVQFTFQLGDTLETRFAYKGEGEASTDWLYIPLTTVLEHRKDGSIQTIKKGGEIQLNNNTLRCIGELDRSDFLISADYAKEKALSVKQFYFFSKYLLSNKEIRNYLSRIESNSTFRAINTPLSYRANDQKSLPIKLFLIVLLLLSSIFSYGFLAHFMVHSQMKNHAVLYLNGFSITRLHRLIVCEILVYSLFCGIAASLLYHSIYQSFLDKHMLYREVTYRFADYLLLNLFFILVCMLTILPFMRIKRKSLDLDRFMREA